MPEHPTLDQTAFDALLNAVRAHCPVCGSSKLAVRPHLYEWELCFKACPRGVLLAIAECQNCHYLLPFNVQPTRLVNTHHS